jgi:hypothetical protein
LLDRCVEHLINRVLPAATEYETAERALSLAYKDDPEPASWEAAGRHATRKAAELAVAVDGLSDRAHLELGRSLSSIRHSVGSLCIWPANGSQRDGCLERVRGVANAYKHGELTETKLPISSDDDVLVVAPGFGIDGFGVGKFNGVEVVVKDKSGKSWKFGGDAPVAIAAWFRFLSREGAVLPCGRYDLFGVTLNP